jgi:hypothetical protein
MRGAAMIDPIARHEALYSRCVVDTDVTSFPFKNDSRAQPYMPLLRDRELSFMTEGELEQSV